MRIGITCYPTYGGSGVVATELARSLARRGHDVIILSLVPPKSALCRRVRRSSNTLSPRNTFRSPRYGPSSIRIA